MSDGELAVSTDETLLTCPSLTSCCAAHFQTGHGPVAVHGPGGWGCLPTGRPDPCQTCQALNFPHGEHLTHKGHLSIALCQVPQGLRVPSQTR